MIARKRILITEDELLVAMDLEKRMVKMGYEVCAIVSTGPDAVLAAATHQPDLVLMDICLPGDMDGIQASERISELYDIPIVYLSANSDENTLNRAKARHPASYLLKPFRERELHICIEMALTVHRLERELRRSHATLERRVFERTAELEAANRALAQEIVERKRAEELALRAQRLECVGALASGVAHDLNNIFTPLIMSAQTLEDGPSPEETRRLSKMMVALSLRGADMVRQILTFVRGSPGERTPFRVEALAADIQRMARDTFPPEIRVQLRYDPRLWSVLGDPTKIHQLLLNLCVNARDAMPKGGTLSIELTNFAVDAAFSSLHGTVKPADYVRLRVADTGTGMPPEVRARIFEPFFTTKPRGQGTGLGLSTVQAITREHEGFLQVDSAPGVGTRFDVFLPGCEQEESAGNDPAAIELPRARGETILVADDERAVREIVCAALEAHGYRVLLADDGVDALSRFALQMQTISAVVTDLGMPHLDGVGFVRAVRRLAPSIPILMLSGRDAAHMPDGEVEALRLDFLAKPFTRHQLLHRLHGVLSSAAEPAHAPGE